MPHYAKYDEQDLKKLGRYCSYVFWANPLHKFRVVIAYNTCHGKPKRIPNIIPINQEILPEEEY
jgi:hypothetical protein